MKKLYIKQKVFSIGEKFTVVDEDQRLHYSVKGSFMKIPKTFCLMYNFFILWPPIFLIDPLY